RHRSDSYPRESLRGSLAVAGWKLLSEETNDYFSRAGLFSFVGESRSDFVPILLQESPDFFKSVGGNGNFLKVVSRRGSQFVPGIWLDHCGWSGNDLHFTFKSFAERLFQLQERA